MSATENKTKGFGGLFTHAAIGAVIAMLLSLLLMIAAAALLANGKIAPEYSGRLVIICVFIGCFLGTLLTTSKQGRGVLTAAILRCLMFVVLLTVFSAACGTERIFNAEFLKSSICSATGCILAGTLRAYKNTRPVKRRKKR